MTTLPHGWTDAPLGDLCEITMGQAPKGDTYNTEGRGWPLIAGAGDFDGASVKPHKFTSTPTRLSAAGDIILGIRASIGERVRSDGEYCLGRGVAGLRSGEDLDDGYLWHWLEAEKETLKSKGRGATFLQVNRTDIAGMVVPLPPLGEQRRIAAILDKADELRTKRRTALAQLDTLTQAIFIDMFGDLSSNRFAWPQAPFVELLERPLRNGVSPSTGGTVEEEVLTLAAITGESFDATAIKSAFFVSSPPAEKRVSSLDFLICRGNGNQSLVGRGLVPTIDLSDVVFPDTMIGARVDRKRLGLAFLEQVWREPFARRQLEAKARTTNGTHKINQTMIEAVVVPVPPIELQDEFDRIVTAQRVAAARQISSKDGLNEIFASLQARAFRGEL